MSLHAVRLTILALLLLAWPAPSRAQSIDLLGTRAAGMSGAFVAVADDASAGYWNPGGFASGAFFSLLLDRTSSTAEPDGAARAGSRSGWLLALGTPPLGLSYYRLRGTRLIDVAPVPGGPADPAVSVESLVSHHVGATLVQSITPAVAVGATLKLVRGIAATDERPATDRESLLDDAAALTGRASNRFDLDIGVMATFNQFKAGITARNLTEPGFDTPGGVRLRLERQVRAGIAIAPVSGWMVAADLDLLRTNGPLGLESRDVALGTEGRVTNRVIVRTGTRFDTSGDGPGGRRATFSAGGSYAVTPSVLIDGQFTGGSEWAGRGWGIAARFVY